jgi:ATPase subunit of ABC transporter with duplicated ATPase domains
VIAFANVSKQYGSQVLFVDGSFQVNPGEKIGLVGANGAGKSTVFRLIVGEELPDDGQVERPRKLTLGYFRQDVGELRGRSILAETCAGAGEVAELADELAHLTAQLEAGGDDLDVVVERYADVEARYSELGGYQLEGRAHGSSPAWASRPSGSATTSARCRAAGRCAWPWPRSSWPSPTCCSSTSRPTTSTSSRSCGSRRSSRPTRARS